MSLFYFLVKITSQVTCGWQWNSTSDVLGAIVCFQPGPLYWGNPSVVKGLLINAGDAGLIPGWGRYPGKGNGNPLQYSCLGNSVAEEPGGPQSMSPKGWTQLSDWARMSTHYPKGDQSRIKEEARVSLERWAWVLLSHVTALSEKGPGSSWRLSLEWLHWSRNSAACWPLTSMATLKDKCLTSCWPRSFTLPSVIAFHYLKIPVVTLCRLLPVLWSK